MTAPAQQPVSPAKTSQVRTLRPGDSEGADLTDANFAGAESDPGSEDLNFSGAILTRADFSNVRLSSADFTDAILTEAVFAGAWIFTSDFTRADLTRANLFGAMLVGAVFVEADLTGADLGGATLGSADFAGANLSEADLIEAHFEPYVSTGPKTNLSGANLTGANLAGANLSGANLTGAILDPDFDRSTVIFDASTIWP